MIGILGKTPMGLPPFGSMVGFGGLTYIKKVLGIQPANLIGYWPLAETSGTTADNAEGTAARDGTYARDVSTMGTVAGIGDGSTAPAFDGVNDYVDIFSASFEGVFDFDKYTIAFWMARTDWTANPVVAPYTIHDNGDNQLFASTSATDNLIQFSHKTGGTTKAVNDTSAKTNSVFYHYALTVDVVADEMKAYWAGSQTGSTQTGLVAYNGDGITTTQCIIGANNQTPANLWVGSLAHFAVWNTALSAANIAALATV